jgi:phosphoglycerate dehydrogenase-like enzyme
MKVVYHAAAGPDLAARLASLPGLDIAICPDDDERRLASLLPDCEVLWHVLQRCTAEMIAAAPKLRLIQKIGVGVNTIDLAAAQARGIPVCNLPGTNSRAVAELTLALMLAVLRRVPRFDASLRSGIWTDLALQDGLGELGGRVVGLVGYGSVPRILAPVLVAMGCEVVYTARHEAPGAVSRFVALSTLLERSDVVSLHLPLTNETNRLIDRAAIGRMKKGSILINTARGGLVDETALTDALRSGQLGGAGLDVFTEEPLPRDAALLALDNVVVTPHVAWTTTGTFDRSFALAAENCRRIMTGTPLLHRVDG